MGFVVANLEKYSEDDWQRYKKWYAVLYVFNKKGRLTSHQIECFGSTADGERGVLINAEKRLDEWLGKLLKKYLKTLRFSASA